MELKEKKKQRSCKDEALFWLEYGDRTELEMVRHLKKKGYDERETAEAMAFLTEYSLIDNERYALKFVEAAMEKGRGPLRIRRELQEKGISSAAADQALCQLYDRTTEREIALRVAQKALRIVCGEMDEENRSEWKLSEKDRMKIARRLASAGFSPQAAFDAINRLK